MNRINHIIKKLSGKTVLEGMPELAYIFDRQGRMLMWNKNIELILGYTAAELFNKQVSDFIAPEFREKTLLAIEAIFQTKEDQTVEYELITKQGERLPYIGSGSLTMVDGEEYFVGMAISTEKLKKTEARLKEQIAETEQLKNQLYAENTYLREEYIEHHDCDEITGKSELLRQILFQIDQVATTEAIVLLKGESGTDKERFAMAIHKKSNRSEHAFIRVNCNSTLVERELFGHEKGAFANAVHKRIGHLEMANEGTIYLEEMGALSIDMQWKLLRFIEKGSFERMGSSKEQKANVRIITSTSINIQELISQGRFLENLYYRINVFPITIAPLRDRPEDIPLIAEHFVQKFNHKLGKNIQRISKKNIRELKAYSWPGNVFELENIIERAVIVSQSGLLQIEPLSNEKKNHGIEKYLPLAEYERRYLIEVLKKTNWRINGQKGAAQILEMHPETLRSRLKKLNIKRT